MPITYSKRPSKLMAIVDRRPNAINALAPEMITYDVPGGHTRLCLRLGDQAPNRHTFDAFINLLRQTAQQGGREHGFFEPCKDSGNDPWYNANALLGLQLTVKSYWKDNVPLLWFQIIDLVKGLEEVLVNQRRWSLVPNLEILDLREGFPVGRAELLRYNPSNEKTPILASEKM